MSMYPIATATATAGQSSILFTGIPQTFTHLQLRFVARSNNNGTGSSVTYLLPNNDFTLIYFTNYMYGDGATFTASFNNTQQIGNFTGAAGSTATANTFGAGIYDILDYANANKKRVIRSTAGYDANGSGRVCNNVVLYNSTAAITSIGLYTEGTLAAGTRADLYGISTSNTTGA
jgi:hypothetical protein